MAEPRTWTLTGSPENHAVTAARGYTLIAERDARVLMDALAARIGVGAP